MAKGRIAKQAKVKLNMIIYGDTFTGKTTLASQLAYFKRPEDGKPFRILYIDAETGGLDSYIDDLEESGVDTGNIYILYTQSLAEVRQYIAKVKNGEDMYVLDEEGNETDEIVLDADGQPFRADAIIVDGASILHMTTQSGLLEFSKKRNKVKADAAGLVGDARLVKIEGSSLEIRDYGSIKFKGQDLILDLMSSGVHCITTCREDEEKKSVKTDDGQIASVATGKHIPMGFKGLDYNTNTVLRMFYDKETGQICAEVEKDRTHVHQKGEIIEDPTLLDWQAALVKNKDRENFVLKNDLTKAVEVEEKLYEHEILKKDDSSDNTTAQVKAEDNTQDETPEYYQKKIKEIINTYNVIQKNEMKTKLTERGLPINYTRQKDVSTLKQMYEVLCD